jgi:hypothetical protein
MFAGAAVVAVVLMGILAAAAFGSLSRETAGVAALVCFVAGAVFLGQWFGPALTGRPPPADRPEKDRPPKADRPM